MSDEEIYQKFVSWLGKTWWGLTPSNRATNKFSKTAMVVSEACIGCGVCVHKCPTDSLRLVPRDKVSDPPEDIRDYGMRFMADRKKGERLLRTSHKG